MDNEAAEGVRSSGVDWHHRRSCIAAVVRAIPPQAYVHYISFWHGSAKRLHSLRLEPVSIPELPPMTQPRIPVLIHTVFPLIRLLLLVPLYPALAYPRVSYVPASEIRQADGSGSLTIAPHATEDSSLLVSAEERALSSQGLSVASASANGQGAYGTFRPARSLAPTTGTNTRMHTPSPSDGQVITVSESLVSCQKTLPGLLLHLVFERVYIGCQSSSGRDEA